MLQDKAVGWGGFTSPDLYNVANDKIACQHREELPISLHLTRPRSTQGQKILLKFILFDLAPALDAKGAQPEDWYGYDDDKALLSTARSALVHAANDGERQGKTKSRSMEQLCRRSPQEIAKIDLRWNARSSGLLDPNLYMIFDKNDRALEYTYASTLSLRSR